MKAAQIIVSVGSTGSGKSHFVKSALRELAPTRLVVIDPDDEYGEVGRIERVSCEQLRVASKAPGFRVRIVPSDDEKLGQRQFAYACAVAWDAAQAAPVVVVAEEIADFVGAGAAPSEWRRLVRRGRKHGVSIFAVTQRPALIDKTVWSQATFVRAGWLNYPADHATIAAALGVPVGEVAALTGHQWIARDRNTGRLSRG